MNSTCGVRWGEDAFWPAMAFGLMGVAATVAALAALVGAVVLTRKTFAARRKVSELRKKGLSTQFVRSVRGSYIEIEASGINFVFATASLFFAGLIGSFAIMTWHFTSCALSVS